MPRTYKPFRFTGVEPGESVRKAGITAAYGNNAPPGAHFDKLLADAYGYEHLLGSASHVASDIATITWNQTAQRFENKAGAQVVLESWDRVAVMGMDTLTADMVIGGTVEHIHIFHIGNGFGQSGEDPKFKLGDAGGGVPYKIRVGLNTKNCKLDLLTDKPFAQLDYLGISRTNQRYIMNQGVGNHIKINGVEIYNPAKAGQIVKFDTKPANPYLIRMNGGQWPWKSGAGVNSQAWFRDLNIALGGQRWNGSAFIETQSRFTLPSLITASPQYFQVNTAKRFMTDISSSDTRVHQRADPTGVSISATASFNGTNTVTFTSGIGNIKNGMRISGGTVPGSPAATTILRSVDTSANTAKMYDALTDAAVNVASASGVAVTINNSGAAGGSHDEDYFQGHRINVGAGALLAGTTFDRRGNINFAVDQFSNFNAEPQTIANDGINGPPRVHNQTQPQSTGMYYYYKA